MDKQMAEAQILTIQDLFSTMKENAITECVGIVFDQYDNRMIIVDDKHIWVRSGAILGYYPGLRHTFFEYSTGQSDYLYIKDQITFDKVIRLVSEGIEQLRKEGVEISKRQVYTVPVIETPVNISEETKARVRALWDKQL